MAPLRLKSLWLAVGWALVLFIIYASLTPRLPDLGVEHGDKAGHMAAYLVLMSWFANIYEARGERLASIAGCIALAVALEFAQDLTATRSFEVADMVAGAAGALCGWLLAPPRLPNYLRTAERFVRPGRAP